MRRVCRSQQDTVYESEQNIEDATGGSRPKSRPTATRRHRPETDILASESTQVANPAGIRDDTQLPREARHGQERPHTLNATSRAVFISYASQDAEAAGRICEALQAAGIEVWFDQSELRGGDAWDQSIRKQIKTCALFIPVISHTTHDRREGYFRLEWKLAVDRCHLMDANMTSCCRSSSTIQEMMMNACRSGFGRCNGRACPAGSHRLPSSSVYSACCRRRHRLPSERQRVDCPLPHQQSGGWTVEHGGRTSRWRCAAPS